MHSFNPSVNRVEEVEAANWKHNKSLGHHLWEKIEHSHTTAILLLHHAQGGNWVEINLQTNKQTLAS